jgi:hypothetical protein
MMVSNMRSKRWIRTATAVACVVSLGFSPSVCLAQTAAAVPLVPATDVTDLVIGDGGTLVGRVHDAAGDPLPWRNVRILFRGGEIATTSTDASGTFEVVGLREGVHEIQAGSTVKPFRLWPRESAPPQIQEVAQVGCTDCPPEQPRRGLLRRAFCKYPLLTTALIGTGIGAAIAIPIAVSQKPASP